MNPSDWTGAQEGGQVHTCIHPTGTESTYAGIKRPGLEPSTAPLCDQGQVTHMFSLDVNLLNKMENARVSKAVVGD